MIRTVTFSPHIGASAFNAVSLKHAMSSIPVISSLLLLSSAALVVGPTAQDHYALIGAVSAAIITLVAVRKYDQSLWNGVAAFLGAMVLGVAMPGATVTWAQYQGYVDEHAYAFITWHIWMLLGFAYGLAGWIVAQSVYAFFVKVVPNFVTRLGDKIDTFFTK
jgi:hypothetical protein